MIVKYYQYIDCFTLQWDAGDYIYVWLPLCWLTKHDKATSITMTKHQAGVGEMAIAVRIISLSQNIIRTRPIISKNSKLLVWHTLKICQAMVDANESQSCKHDGAYLVATRAERKPIFFCMTVLGKCLRKRPRFTSTFSARFRNFSGVSPTRR